MQNEHQIPLILFSGLAADAAVFLPQTQAFPNLEVQGWIEPRPDDTFETYCRRLAGVIRPRGRCVIGGMSFGGMVALEVARHLDPLAVVLIASAREPAELPRL